MKGILAALAAGGLLAGCAVSTDGLSQESAHHTASELDLRTADHCDCNRALPGSTQSSVWVPEVDR
jgi:hypothetical protein